jgi:amino acid transporter
MSERAAAGFGRGAVSLARPADASGEPVSGAEPTLLRSIGFGGASLLVLNSMIGAGIFALPGVVGAAAGELSPWLFAAVGLCFLCVVLVFAELAALFTGTGGPVLYAGAAFGPLAGFGAGWLLYVSRMTAFAANATAMAAYLGGVWSPVADGAGRLLFIAAICLGFTAVNYVGLRDGVRTVALFTLCKLTPLALMVLVGLGQVDAGTLFPGEWPTVENPGQLTLLLIYAYLGFEAPVTVSGETREPRRTMPRALLFTVLGVTVLYALIALVFVAVLPAPEREGATLVDVGRALLGEWGALALALAAVFSIGGNLAANMLSVPRVSFALGEQGLLPDWFCRVHPRFHTPGNSVLLLGALCLLFALTGTFTFLAVASALMRMLTYLLCIAALPVIRRRLLASRPTGMPGRSVALLVPVAAFALCLWIAAQADVRAWSMIAGLSLLGLALYWLAGRAGGGRAGFAQPPAADADAGGEI